MTVEEMTALFEKHEDVFLKDEEETGPTHRNDLNAFLILDRLCPGDRHNNRIITAAEHDQIWLGVELEPLAAVITEEDIRQLIRCGVMLDVEVESLSMFR